MRIFVACIAFISAALVVGSPAAAAPDRLPGKWVEVRTPYFTVVSNARPREARRTAEHFEQIRQLFARSLPRAADHPPLEVFAARGERTMKRLLPGWWESGKTARPAGAFRRNATAQMIALRADYLGSEEFGLIYHEYFHFLARSARLPMPLWINEGLAGFWGGSRLTADFAEIGRPDTSHLATLREGRFLPLDLLLTIDRHSEEYRDRDKTLLFHAQSWALVHYILLGDESGEGTERLRRCLALAAGGMGNREAAREVFGDLDELEAGLKKYVRQLLFRYVKIPPPTPTPADQLRVRELPAAEAAALVAHFLLVGRRTEEAEELLSLALEGAPELAATHEAAGQVHLRRGRYPEAASAFERAIALPGAGPVAHYALALLAFRQDRSSDGLAAVEQRLMAAVSVRRDFAPAFVRLAEVYRRTDAGSERALAMVRRGRRLEPEHALYQLKEAQILLASGEAAAAAATARDVVSRATASDSVSFNNSVCWQGSLWGLAAAVLPACGRALELDPECWGCQDSRGVARALSGDPEGALSDLRAARALAADRWPEEVRAKRDAWIASLERGVPPFAGDGFDRLRDDPEEFGLGWLY